MTVESRLTELAGRYGLADTAVSSLRTLLDLVADSVVERYS